MNHNRRDFPIPKKDDPFFLIDREIKENYDVENKKGIMYNGIVQQFGKGM